MGCGCGGSQARERALENQGRQQARQQQGSRVPPTQTPGYYSGPKGTNVPAPKPQ